MAGRIGTKSASSVGMMEGAFFVGRSELIAWVNNLLQVSITKVEQCASGAIYCQILDSCHPNQVMMKKVNWMAKSDHEFIPNYKILQAAFDKLFIERHIPVDMLIRAKYQDNLEMLQWMKCYWDHESCGVGDYDPLTAREGRPLPPWAHAGAAPAPGAKEPRGAAAGPGAARAKAPAARPASKESGYPAAPGARPGAPRAAGRGPATPLTGQAQAARNTAAARQAPAVDTRLVEELQDRVATQQEEIEELRATFDGLERERDYYFRKLREVEILCTTLKTQFESGEPVNDGMSPEKLVTDIQTILYAEDEEEDGEEMLGQDEGGLPVA